MGCHPTPFPPPALLSLARGNAPFWHSFLASLPLLLLQSCWLSHQLTLSPVTSSLLSFFFFFNLFYFWLCWVFVAASRGYSLLGCAGFSLQWLLLLRSTGSRHAGFSSCGSQALERTACSVSLAHGSGLRSLERLGLCREALGLLGHRQAGPGTSSGHTARRIPALRVSPATGSGSNQKWQQSLAHSRTLKKSLDAT